MTNTSSDKLLVTEIFKLSYILYKRNLRDIIIINSLLLLPFILFMMIIGITLNTYIHTNKILQIVLIVINLIFFLFIPTIAYNTSLILLHKSNINESTDWKTVIKLGINKIRSAFITGFALLLCSLLAITPIINIFFGIYMSLAMPTTILTEKKGFESLKYSYNLTKGAELDIIIIQFFYGLAGFIIGIFTMLIMVATKMTQYFNLAIFYSIGVPFLIISFLLSIYYFTTIYLLYINREMIINGNKLQKPNNEHEAKIDNPE